MAEVDIEIGGRIFKVACQDGEQPHLLSAASLLDNEATHLMNAAGRLPEPKMLLMAGLMLADKMAGQSEVKATQTEDRSALEAQLADATTRISELEAALAALASESEDRLARILSETESLAQDLAS